jgi:hypothetical protein
MEKCYRFCWISALADQKIRKALKEALMPNVTRRVGISGLAALILAGTMAAPASAQSAPSVSEIVVTKPSDQNSMRQKSLVLTPKVQTLNVKPPAPPPVRINVR